VSTLITPQQYDSALSTDQTPAVRAFAEGLAEGEHWYHALAGAVHLWNREEECYGGRYFRFLIASEALDLLLVMERICWDFRHVLPQEERDALFFFAQPPFTYSDTDFAHLLGEEKYRAYLSYFYGVTLEEVLLHAVEDEILKATNYGLTRDNRDPESPFTRLYGKKEHELLREFGKERERPVNGVLSLTDWKEFLYWLFKQRVANCLPERLASDTQKGLDTLRMLRGTYPAGPFDTLRGYSE
jgi:hypothetical protein